MKKLNKINKNYDETIESFACECDDCACGCGCKTQAWSTDFALDAVQDSGSEDDSPVYMK